MKKIAIVASGWHFPSSFYENMARQKLPKGWGMDLFCIAHRDPADALREKSHRVFPDSLRGNLDRKLYNAIIGETALAQIGWKYHRLPNTVGDWGNTNQWFEMTGDKAKGYDLYLFTHDDNLLIHDRIIIDTINDPNFPKWGICANSVGMPFGWLRGSFEFFKPRVLEKLGWKFDLSRVSLTREGKTEATDDLAELNDWNYTVHPLMEFIGKKKIRVAFFSPSYRVSAYVIEGERGYISNTHGQNTESEDKGLAFLHDNGII